MLILERARAPGRAEGDLLTAAFQFQGVAGLQMQFFPEGLGNNDAACFINGKADVHSGIILWFDPSVNTMCYNRTTGGQVVGSCGDLPEPWISNDHKHAVISLR